MSIAQEADTQWRGEPLSVAQSGQWDPADPNAFSAGENTPFILRAAMRHLPPQERFRLAQEGPSGVSRGVAETAQISLREDPWGAFILTFTLRDVGSGRIAEDKTVYFPMPQARADEILEWWKELSDFYFDHSLPRRPGDDGSPLTASIEQLFTRESPMPFFLLDMLVKRRSDEDSEIYKNDAIWPYSDVSSMGLVDYFRDPALPGGNVGFRYLYLAHISLFDVNSWRPRPPEEFYDMKDEIDPQGGLTGGGPLGILAPDVFRATPEETAEFLRILDDFAAVVAVLRRAHTT